MRNPFRSLQVPDRVLGGRSARGAAVWAATGALAATAVAAGVACAAGRGAGVARPDRAVITRDQILATHRTSAYDVVASLRSNWLLPRGVDSFNTPGAVVVYLDNARLGGVDALRGIASDNLASIRFISAVDASARWGIGHTQGVIFLATQVGP